MKFKRVAIIFFSFLIIICLLLFYLGIMIQFFLYPGIYLESMEKAKVFQTIDENIAKTPNAQFIEMDQGSRPFVQNILDGSLDLIAFFIFCMFLIRDSKKKFLRIIGLDVLISISLSYILGLL